ncbi:MAG TPA: DUF2911 domain-containing protein [Thermoanaerobaculia bacterium]|nr:DUF2911 domain-containing protein [Thermoanaerobaculia bacterium]
MFKRFLAVLVLLIPFPAVAQLAIPRVSPAASVTQTIGTTKITVDYHRPGVKGRIIWGGLVPYDQPWRMGANEATTISFSDPVKVNGNEVPAGKYSFFAIPGKAKWTLVINKDPNQGGASGYDQSKDALRVEVTPAKAEHTEWMRFTIEPTSPSAAVVRLNWEKIAIPINVEVDVAGIVWKNVDSTLASTYGGAASWALDRGERLEEGLAWTDQAIAASGENVLNLWTKARLLQKLGRSKEALPVMEKTLTLARGNVPADFLAILEGSHASIKADASGTAKKK